MLEWLAIWYLNRCGRVVMPPAFVGMVLGNAHAQRTASSREDGDKYTVWLPYNAPVAALSNTVLHQNEEQMVQ